MMGSRKAGRLVTHKREKPAPAKVEKPVAKVMKLAAKPAVKKV